MTAKDESEVAQRETKSHMGYRAINRLHKNGHLNDTEREILMDAVDEAYDDRLLDTEADNGE